MEGRALTRYPHHSDLSVRSDKSKGEMANFIIVRSRRS
jgi:hypothetical protein